MTQDMPTTVTDAEGVVWTQRPDGGWAGNLTSVHKKQREESARLRDAERIATAPERLADALTILYRRHGRPRLTSCRVMLYEYAAAALRRWESDARYQTNGEAHSWHDWDWRRRWDFTDSQLDKLVTDHHRAHEEWAGLSTRLVHRLLKAGYRTEQEIARIPDLELLDHLSRTELEAVRQVIPIDPQTKYQQELIDCPHCDGTGSIHPSELPD